MENNGGKIVNRDIYDRLMKLEVQMASICNYVEAIKANDLKHIQVSLDKIEDKVHELDKSVTVNAVKIAILVSLITAAASTLLNKMF